MVRKAIVKDLCDQCLDDTGGDLETEADFRMVINLNEGGEIAYDLCLDHANALSVNEMLARARDVKAPSQSGKHIRHKIRCPVCSKYYSEGSGMALHVKSSHPEEFNARKVIVT
jgi:hypothetical protein